MTEHLLKGRTKEECGFGKRYGVKCLKCGEITYFKRTGTRKNNSRLWALPYFPEENRRDVFLVIAQSREIARNKMKRWWKIFNGMYGNRLKKPDFGYVEEIPGGIYYVKRKIKNYVPPNENCFFE